VLKGVILAAGNGSRMGTFTASVPKALLDVAGRPLIDYTLGGLLAIGVDRIVVVTGYLGETLEGDLRQRRPEVAFEFLHNPRYERANGDSLRRARQAVGGESFLLVMADHMLSGDLLKKLAAAPSHGDAMAVDYSARTTASLAEATRVLVNEDAYVVAIGKNLDPWSGVDTGAFLMSPRVFEAVDDLPDDSQLSAILQRYVAMGGALRAIDVSGSFWLDVDTAEDYALAQELAATHAQSVV
jgi:choline kinase